MASRSFHALFLRARDQYFGSGRWMALVVLTLVLLHVAILAPFIDESHRETVASSEIERLDAIAQDLDELQRALQAANSEVRPAIHPALEGLADNLSHDLERLEATRRQILAEARAQDDTTQTDPTRDGATLAGTILAGTTGSGAASPGESSTLGLTVRPFLLDDPDWIADIRDASGREEMLAALSPIVDALIIEPRYFDANRIWKEKGLSTMVSRLDAAAALIPRLRSRFPEGRADWAALVGALSRSNRLANELQLAPPNQPFWWTTGAPDAVLELGLTTDVKLTVHTPEVLTELADGLTATGESQRSLAGRVTAARSALGESPEQGRIAGLELAVLAPMFPLLIGLLVSSAMFRRSSHLRELGLSASLAIEHGSPPALHRWLLRQVQWSSTVTSTAAAWRRCLIQTLLAYFLIMAWIAVAADQLRQLRNLDQQRLMLFTVAGATLVLVAVAHRLLIVRRALAIPHDRLSEPQEVDPTGTFDPTIETVSLDAASLDGAVAEPTSPETIPAEPAALEDDPIDSQPLKR